MTWLKLGDEFPEQTADLSHAAFRAHVEGLSWAMRRENGGVMMPRDLRRCLEMASPAEAREAVKELVAAGLWEEIEGGWKIVHHMDKQRTPEQVKADRDKAAEHKRNQRGRQRMSPGGHSGGTPGGESPGGVPRPRPDQSSPVPDQVLVENKDRSLTSTPVQTRPESDQSRPEPEPEPDLSGPEPGPSSSLVMEGGNEKGQEPCDYKDCLDASVVKRGVLSLCDRHGKQAAKLDTRYDGMGLG